MFMVKKGTTSQSINLRILDSATGIPDTSVTAVTTGLQLCYRRDGGADTNLSAPYDIASLTDAFTAGGLKHIRAGYYRVDVDNGAFATGSNNVLIAGEADGKVILGKEVQLVSYDPNDTVRLGLTALPNAAAEAAGGLFTRGTGAGQITQDANGRIDTNIVALNGSAAGSGTLPDNSITLTTFDTSVSDLLIAAGNSGDPWQTQLPGSYISGSAGSIIGGNLDAAVSTRAETGDAMTLTTGERDSVADALLKRDWSAVTGEASRSVLNALRFLRNKWTLTGTALSVKKEDDSSTAWTGTVTTNASADPITGNDPS